MTAESGWRITVDSNGNILSIAQGLAETDSIPVPTGINPMTILGNPSLFQWNGTTIVSKPPTLQQAQTAQRALIKSSFITASTANVTDSNGIVWEGGIQSGNSIFLGCQLAQQAGQSTITLYDANKAPHSMTIAEGMGAAALIGAAYQEALAKKNTLYANIDAANSVSAVQSVTWQ